MNVQHPETRPARPPRRLGRRGLIVLLTCAVVVMVFGPGLWLRYFGAGWLERTLKDALSVNARVESLEGGWFQPIVARGVRLESDSSPSTRMTVRLSEARLSATVFDLTTRSDTLVLALVGVEVDLRTAQREPALDRFLDQRLRTSLGEPGRRIEVSLQSGRVLLDDGEPHRLDAHLGWDGDRTRPVTFNVTLEHAEGDRLDAFGSGRLWEESGPELALELRATDWRLDPWSRLCERVGGIALGGRLQSAHLRLPDLAASRGSFSVEVSGTDVTVQPQLGVQRTLGTVTLAAEGTVAPHRMVLNVATLDATPLRWDLTEPGWIERRSGGFDADLACALQATDGRELASWLPGGRRLDLAPIGPTRARATFVGGLGWTAEGGFTGIQSGSCGFEARCRGLEIGGRILNDVRVDGVLADGVLTLRQGGAVFAEREMMAFGSLALNRIDPTHRLEIRWPEPVPVAVGGSNGHVLEASFAGSGFVARTADGFALTVHLTTPSLRMVADPLRVPRAGRAEVTAHGVYHPESRRWDGIGVRLVGEDVDVTAADGMMTARRFEGRVSGRIPRSWLIPWLGSDAANRSSAITFEGRVDTEDLVSISDVAGRFVGRIDAERLEVGGLTLEGVNARLSAHEGLVRLEDLTARLGSGSVTADVTTVPVPTQTDARRSRATARLSDVPISAIPISVLRRIHPMFQSEDVSSARSGTVRVDSDWTALGGEGRASLRLQLSEGSVDASWLLREVAARLPEALPEPERAELLGLSAERSPLNLLARLATEGFVYGATSGVAAAVVEDGVRLSEPLSLISAGVTFTAHPGQSVGETTVTTDLLRRCADAWTEEERSRSRLAGATLEVHVVETVDAEQRERMDVQVIVR